MLRTLAATTPTAERECVAHWPARSGTALVCLAWFRATTRYCCSRPFQAAGKRANRRSGYGLQHCARIVVTVVILAPPLALLAIWYVLPWMAAIGFVLLVIVEAKVLVVALLLLRFLRSP